MSKLAESDRGTVLLRIRSSLDAERVRLALAHRWTVTRLGTAEDRVQRRDATLAGPTVFIMDISSFLDLREGASSSPVVVLASPTELEALLSSGKIDDVLVDPWTDQELIYRLERLQSGRQRRLGSVWLRWYPNEIALAWRGERRSRAVSPLVFLFFDLLARNVGEVVPRTFLSRTSRGSTGEIVSEPLHGAVSSSAARRGVDMAISRLRHALEELSAGAPIQLHVSSCRERGYALSWSELHCG